MEVTFCKGIKVVRNCPSESNYTTTLPSSRKYSKNISLLLLSQYARLNNRPVSRTLAMMREVGI
jgi:hypothetical protein